MSIDENKAVARKFFDDVVSRGNLAVIDDLCAADYRLHTFVGRQQGRQPQGTTALFAR